jgi:hypothetical protein
VDGAPAEGYRAVRTVGANRGGQITSGIECQPDNLSSLVIRPRQSAPIGILTGEYGAKVLKPLIGSLERNDIRILEVTNHFFGGNIKVSGLMVGEDVQRVLESEPDGHRYLLPDVCLNNGRFLDGLRPEDLCKYVEVVATDGIALRSALEPQEKSDQVSGELVR